MGSRASEQQRRWEDAAVFCQVHERQQSEEIPALVDQPS
jgi:hypothetical protein